MKFSTLILLLVLALQANAQNNQKPKNIGPGAIKGVVLDSSTKSAMAYATVALLNPQNSAILDGVITKNNGEFNFEGLPLGEYDIKCTFMGYKTEFVKSVKISADNPKITLSNVLLKAKSVLKEGVSVVSEKSEVTYMLDKKVINIAENPNVQGGRIADALQNIPSISVDLEGKVSIRGSANFQVLIDGRPSPMPGNDALKSIPADAVENVELITNPTAKYDPDGTAGILNIVLKKMSLNGINGMISGSGGIKDKYTSSGIFNYRYDDLNFYTGIDYSNMTFKPSSKFIRESYTPNSDTVSFIDPAIDRKMVDKNFSGKAGIEYTIDPMRFISISANVNKGDFQRLMPTKMREWNSPNSFSSYYLNDDEYLVSGYYSTANAYYQQKFNSDGHQISSTLNTIFWDGGGDERIVKSATDKDFNVNNTLKEYRSNADSRTIMTKFKTDYVLPLSDGYKIEAGYNFDYTQDFSDFLYENYNFTNKTWERNSDFTNDTKYYHTINALYTTFTGAIWDFNYQAGIRCEYFNRRLNQTTNSQVFKYNKINFFPTAHISRNFEGDQQLQISYSRRVQRPDVYALNPFPDYVDDYIVSIGNPSLMPEFTDSYEINYQKGFKTMFFSIQSYYRNTDNAISRVLKINSDKKIWITAENVARNYTIGAELSANLNLFKGFRLNINGNLYNYRFKTNESGLDGENGGTVLDGNIMAFYSFSPNTLLQLNTFYMGPRYSIDGKVNETYSVGASIRQFFFDKQLTLYFNGRNILNTVKYTSENKRKEFYTYGSQNTEGANLSIGFSININNYEQKQRPEDTIEKTNVGGSGGY